MNLDDLNYSPSDDEDDVIEEERDNTANEERVGNQLGPIS